MIKVRFLRVFLPIVASLFLVVSAVVSFGEVWATGGNYSTNKVNICHRTDSQSNPWVAIRVDRAAFDGQGENDHEIK